MFISLAVRHLLTNLFLGILFCCFLTKALLGQNCDSIPSYIHLLLENEIGEEHFVKVFKDCDYRDHVDSLYRYWSQLHDQHVKTNNLVLQKQAHERLGKLIQLPCRDSTIHLFREIDFKLKQAVFNKNIGASAATTY